MSNIILQGADPHAGPVVPTVYGKVLNLYSPDPELICIEDIAHGLAHLCRFSGHTSRLYSVAEHSLYVSQLADPEDALWGLLHDASEAYLGDISAQIKPLLPAYLALEDTWMRAICGKFNLPPNMPSSVKRADRRMLSLEARVLMPSTLIPEGLRWELEPLAWDEPWIPAIELYPRKNFLARFQELTA